MTASFRAGETVLHHEGQRVHPQQAEHSERLEQRFYQVGEDVWCFVGNGLSIKPLFAPRKASSLSIQGEH